MPECKSCGDPVRCNWQDCHFPHFCRRCKSQRPHWSNAEQDHAQESQIGFPCWVKNQNTEQIEYVKHHPYKSNVKLVYSPDNIKMVRNDIILMKTLPLPHFPRSKETGNWVEKPHKEVYGYASYEGTLGDFE